MAALYLEDLEQSTACCVGPGFIKDRTPLPSYSTVAASGHEKKVRLSSHGVWQFQSFRNRKQIGAACGAKFGMLSLDQQLPRERPTSPTLSRSERAALRSPALDRVREEIREVEDAMRNTDNSNRGASSPTPQPKFGEAASFHQQSRVGFESSMVRPTSGGYSRPCSASSLRKLGLDEPVHPQYPAHLLHLQADGDDTGEDDEDELEPYEEIPAIYTALDGWHPTSPETTQRPGSGRRPQHFHYLSATSAGAQNHEPLRRPARPSSAQLRSEHMLMRAYRGAAASPTARPASATLHMPRPSGGIIHQVARPTRPASASASPSRSGGFFQRPSSANLARPASAVSLRSTATSQRPSSNPLARSASAASLQQSRASAASLRQSMSGRRYHRGGGSGLFSQSGFSRGPGPLRKSPTGVEIAEAMQNEAELQNVLGLPRVTRRRNGPTYDSAAGCYFESMSKAQLEGRELVPKGRKMWDCVIIQPGKQQTNRLVNVRVREELEDDSDNYLETPRRSSSLLRIEVPG